MSQIHDPIVLYCGDTWEISGACKTADGLPLDLTGAAIQWLLDDIDGQTNKLTLPIGPGLVVSNVLGGLISIIVTASQTAAIPPGSYRDMLRVTLASGAVTTQWSGEIVALAPNT